MINIEVTRNTFETIRELGALCATPGVNNDTQEKANRLIQRLIEGVLSPSVTELTSKASGIIMK